MLVLNQTAVSFSRESFQRQRLSSSKQENPKKLFSCEYWTHLAQCFRHLIRRWFSDTHLLYLPPKGGNVRLKRLIYCFHPNGSKPVCTFEYRLLIWRNMLLCLRVPEDFFCFYNHLWFVFKSTSRVLLIHCKCDTVSTRPPSLLFLPCTQNYHLNLQLLLALQPWQWVSSHCSWLVHKFSTTFCHSRHLCSAPNRHTQLATSLWTPRSI